MSDRPIAIADVGRVSDQLHLNNAPDHAIRVSQAPLSGPSLNGAVFPMGFQEGKRFVWAKSGKRPTQIGERLIEEVGCLIGGFRHCPMMENDTTKKAHSDVYDVMIAFAITTSIARSGALTY